LSDAIEALCRLCGIEREYHDIWGKRHAVTAQTAQALAAAMGVDLSRGIEAAVTGLEQHRWRRVLDPVRVVRARERPIEIPIRLPVDVAARDIAWTLTLESGERSQGKLRPADLPSEPGADIDGRRYAGYRFTLAAPLPAGYHDFRLDAPSETHCRVIVAPDECYLPAAVADAGRVWGPALQLYTVRSRRNWGIGDFSDLRAAVERFGAHGVGVVGLNPLHALYPHNPQHASPYSPSSRFFLNVLYIDVEAVPEFVQCEAAQQEVYAREFQQKLDNLRAAELVDYPGVAAAKLPILEILYQYFRAQHLPRDSGRAQAFRAYQAHGGERLYRHTLYEALQEHFHRSDAAVWGWPVWPQEYRNPQSASVIEFAERERARIEFYQYLQWQADQQLSSAGRRSAEIGLGVGLYQDLAVSVDRGGAETWALQSLYALDASIGAPPDELALQGQNWGLPPLVPSRLTDAAYEPFVATLRANMRHAGALRIDHVMGLMRLFWVPPGASAKDGAYVRYPFADLLGILALESQRNRCLVIGEDLGTVPDEVRAALAPMQVLSYRLFYFEREPDGEFKRPAAYPALALAAVTTHDLPTLAGFWKGEDLRERERLGLFPSEQTRQQQILQRTQDRMRVLTALARERLLPPGVNVDPASVPDMTPELARAIHIYLARAPSKVMMFQPDDMYGELRQVNLPGTTDEYPNWRRKLAWDLDDLVRDARARRLLDALREVRGPGAVAERARPPRRRGTIPDATYRLQFHRDFTFTRAAELVPYLHRLGISHCYASPYLKARPGSRHGYDIVDHNALNPEIGSAEDYERFVAVLHAHRMGQVLDIVPNHMGIGSDNAWWMDILENGRASVYAGFFDIDWRPLKVELRGKVLLPVLGKPYGGALEDGELRLVFDAAHGAFYVTYYDHRFPIDPSTYPQVLEQDLGRLEQALGAGHARLHEFQALIAGFRHLPGRDELTHAKVSERHRDKEVHKRRLAEMCTAEPAIGRYLHDALTIYNGADGVPPRYGMLHALLESQAYRVAYWRTASDEINYRRFFDINDLAALRQENPQTFVATHRLVSELVASGKVNGLRIDHPDGLYDPLEYYRRLQGFVMAAVRGEGAPETPQAAPETLYVVAEKILAEHERLPDDWPVHGTTGYDFANLVSGFLVHPGGERELTRLYNRFIGRALDFDELLNERKRLIMRVALSSDLNVLANYLNRISESDWYARDHTLISLREALRDVVAYFPVYRTYVRADHVSAEDRRHVEWAVAQAKRYTPAADLSVYDFVRDVLLLEGLDRRDVNYRRAVVDFAMRFQQYTAPVMAKGLEDTSFYIYNRLVSLNEVGGDPRRFGISIAAFHHANQERLRRWPHAMVSTSSHDSKRSEDVRARIHVLSELAGEWRTQVLRWARINRAKRRTVNGEPAPSRNDEYLLYQTLVGVWPLEQVDDGGLAPLCERIEAYMLKAVREAKVHTSWINPNAEYEEAVTAFVRALLAPGRNLFLDQFRPFQQRVAGFGMSNSLAQVVLKLTSPGMPDLYQGTEWWDFSLVDPDNRRAVDYTRRARMLADLEAQVPAAGAPRAAWVRGLFEAPADGRAKLFLTWKTLMLRRARAREFREGDYIPLAVDGRLSEHVCAYARRYGEWFAMVVVPRWYARLGADLPVGAVWSEVWVEAPTSAATQTCRNVLTGETVPARARDGKPWYAVADLLANVPVGIFEPG